MIQGRVPAGPDCGDPAMGVTWAAIRARCWAHRRPSTTCTFLTNTATTSEEAEYGLGDQETS